MLRSEYLSDGGEARTSLASLIRAARYVDPPWSGWNFFISVRCARPIVVGARAGLQAKDLIGLLLRHFAGRGRARPRCRVTLRVFTPAGLPAVKIRHQ